MADIAPRVVPMPYDDGGCLNSEAISVDEDIVFAKKWLNALEAQLNDVVGFWLQYSIDRVHGGFLTCLDRDGSVYDDHKYVWMQAQQTWIFSKLYLEMPMYSRKDILNVARNGLDFLRSHAYHQSNQGVYYSLERNGRPMHIQRDIFTECYYAMALSEYARAHLNTYPHDISFTDMLFTEAVFIINKVLERNDRITVLSKTEKRSLGLYYDYSVSSFDMDYDTENSSKLLKRVHNLNRPVILLNAISELRLYKPGIFEDQLHQMAKEISMHAITNRKVMLETVKPDGSPIHSVEGRVFCPGHSLEAGWLLLDYCNRPFDTTELNVDSTGNDSSKNSKSMLAQLAIDIIDWSLIIGWDSAHGGLFSVLDIEGHSPPSLEWNMKLWWPHNEAMTATLMVWGITGCPEWASRFTKVVEYTLTHFPDTPSNAIAVPRPYPRGLLGQCPSEDKKDYDKPTGEWFGYLDREGRPTHRFKGDNYKGCFHVPRSLFMCITILRRRLQLLEGGN